MIDVTIQLLCARQTGILSRLIRNFKLFGLTYSGHNMEGQGGNSLITVNGSGELNCTREKLEQVLRDFPGVISVSNISIRHEGDEVSAPKTGISSGQIDPFEQIDPLQALTPAILLIAEKRLAETLGPVASYLVETAAQSSRNSGELFTTLSQELSSQKERDDFLSIVKNPV